MKYPYTLPELPYEPNALETFIDGQTMEIHHSKHHQAYVDKLNAALEGHTELHEKELEEILTDIKTVPEEIRSAVQNNGGGHYNHSLFWKMMKSNLKAELLEPIGKLAEAIKEKFGDFNRFKKEFEAAAMSRFGSGWTWLVKDSAGNLKVYSTPNQDTPLADGYTPILGLDVWEHAYYLKYKNARPSYATAFWTVVDWEEAERKFSE